MVRSSLGGFLCILLVVAADAKIHTSFRGGSRRNPSQSELVGTESEDSDLTSQADDAKIDDNEDPESVYEATVREEEAKADRAAHMVQYLAPPPPQSSASPIAPFLEDAKKPQASSHRVNSETLTIAAEKQPSSATLQSHSRNHKVPRPKHVKTLVEKTAQRSRTHAQAEKVVPVMSAATKERVDAVSQDSEDLDVMNEVNAPAKVHLNVMSEETALANLKAGQTSDETSSSGDEEESDGDEMQTTLGEKAIVSDGVETASEQESDTVSSEHQRNEADSEAIGADSRVSDAPKSDAKAKENQLSAVEQSADVNSASDSQDVHSVAADAVADASHDPADPDEAAANSEAGDS